MTDTAGEISAEQVNTIIRTVAKMTADGNEQLSILARALVVGCKSCTVSKESAIEIIEQLFDEEIALVRLDQ